nr:hypothetical protein (aph1 5'-region) - fission yeast (Schizosaccharomyces pombe) [Schizosaccharomyces pombe]
MTLQGLRDMGCEHREAEFNQQLRFLQYS